MKNAVLLHGAPGKEEYYKDTFPSPSNAHWFPWLQKQLVMKDILAQTPEMPKPYEPVYELWKREFERFDITPETILVGHSFGGGFIVRWLSEHKDVKVGKVVLVAPWVNPGRYKDTDFFDFEIDPGVAARTAGITIFNSDDDKETTQESTRLLKQTIEGVKFREFHGYGHFIYKHMKTFEFPELLEEAIS